MRLLAFGDIHLGAGFNYGAAPGDRLRDQEQVLGRIAEIAGEQDVTAVLFAGDAFETRRPSPAELMVWRRFCENLRYLGLPFFVIAGNHDVSAPELPTALEAIGSCGREPSIDFVNDGREGIYLATLPWTPVSRLVALQGGGDRDTLHERAARLLERTAAGLRERIQGDATTILMAHWSVAGASLPNGLPVDQLREPVLEPNVLVAQGWDYVVLGHIHKAQWCDADRDKVFYVGSPMPLNFGEANDLHGVYIIDTDQPAATFVKIESRRFVTVDVDLVPTVSPDGHGRLPDGDDFLPNILHDPDYEMAAVATRIREQDLTDAIVRIRYRATEEQARRIDQAAIRKLVADAGAHKLYAIQPEIVRSDRARVAGVDETLGESEAMERWLQSEDLPTPGLTGGRQQGKALSSGVLARHARYLEELA